MPELDIEMLVSPVQFEEIIGEVLADFRQPIEQILQKCELDAGQIQLVIRTGDSSFIPAVRDILDSRLPNRVIEHDPFTSVAAGLAIAEFKGLGLKEHARNNTEK